MTAEPLLSVRDLVVRFPIGRRRAVHAVSNVDVDLYAGETLGVVGESGCGKSSLARAVVQLPRPTSGSVRLAGTELTTLPADALRAARRDLQIIFQDPISTLNPRRRVADSIARGARNEGDATARRARVDEMLEAVGLDPKVGQRKPHEFSGGQAQRICIARALISSPKVLVCDEIVSALDVSVQAQILTLLEAMKQAYGLTLLFISHDLAVVKNVSDRIAVMYLGRICEVGATEDLYRSPRHPYTRLLLSAVLTPDPSTPIEPEAIVGEIPSPIDPPSGCRFRTRCPIAQDICAVDTPPLRAVEGVEGQSVACHFPLDASVHIAAPGEG